MCMIAYAPAGAGTLTPTVIGTAMQRHPDGFGLAWRDTSGDAPMLRTATYSPSEGAQFRATLASVQQSGAEFAVHFRMATSGPVNAAMAHPFVYTDPDGNEVAILHNGIINISHDRAVESDTAAFVRLVLAALPARWWDQPALVYLVREAIGWSKLTIMTAESTAIVGEEKGEWVDGIWYSSDHKPNSWDKWKATNKGHITDSDYAARVTKARQQADPASKRSAKRAAAQARRDAAKAVKAGRLPTINAEASKVGVIPFERSLTVPLVTGEAAYIPEGFEASYGLRHAGHNVSALVDMPLDMDADYVTAVICEECATTGDVYVIDGQRYIDLAHFGPGEREDAHGDLTGPSTLVGLAEVAV